MPINYTIIYNESAAASVCADNVSPPSLTVDLVQDAIVKHLRKYVDVIEIVYSKDALGDYPTSPFSLVLENNTYDIEPIVPEQIVPTAPPAVAFVHSITPNATSYTVTFTPPDDGGNVFTLFNFGSDSGPATKLTVKVKREPNFACP